jgi:hypothetical protein
VFDGPNKRNVICMNRTCVATVPDSTTWSTNHYTNMTGHKKKATMTDIYNSSFPSPRIRAPFANACCPLVSKGRKERLAFERACGYVELA